MQRTFSAILVALLVVVCAPRSADATTILTFNGSGYQDGQVTYAISGDTLTITLANTAIYGSAKVAPSDVLTGVIFTLPDGYSLVPVSATVTADSTVAQSGTCNPGPCSSSTTDVGGEWGYQTAPFSGTGAPTEPYNAGIGSAGQVVGNGTQFPGGINLDDPVSLNGLNFGLVGTNYTSSNAVKKLQEEPLINNAVTFTLTIVGGTLLESQITNWALVFGTSWGEGTVPPDSPPFDPSAVPEPSSLLLLGGGLTLMASALRRRRARRR